MAAVINLNDAQQDAVCSNENVLIFSVPGSGKTRVLIERVKEILRTISHPAILLITFSNQAADELRDRLKRAIRPEQMPCVRVSTFHAAALRQLTQGGKKVNVLNDVEANHYVALAIRQTGVDIEFESATALITACKLNRAEFANQPEVLALEEAYNEFLRSKNLMDFTDMMVRSVSLMRAKNRADRLPRIPATHILVDEMQDADDVQLEWLFCHIDDNCIAMGVGDDDQSIYRFRGATGYAGMMKFAQMTGAKIIKFNTNYRSTEKILEYSARVIKNNLKRVPKELVSVRGPGLEPKLVLYSDREDQYEDIVRRIVEICKTNPVPAPREDGAAAKYAYTVAKGQITVLCRANFNLMPIQRELIKAQVPCIRMGRKSIWEENVVQVFTSLLRALYSNDSTGLEVALRWYGISDVVLEDIRNRFKCAHNFFDPFHAASKHCGEYGKNVAEFAVLAGGWIKTLKNADDPSDAAQGVIYGVSSWMLRVLEERNQDSAKLKAKRDTRGINLIESALELLDLVRGDIRQRLMLAQKDDEPKMARVVLQTFHASKGTESDYVFLADCNQGLTPSKEAGLSEDALEEERRLFYVAMTRARDGLFVYADETKVSQFVLEAGFVLPEKEKRPEFALRGG